MERIDKRWLIIGALVLAAIVLNRPSVSFAAVARVVQLFVLLFPAIILHEVAHGYVAYLLGDPTAKRMGRLTLNPLKHIDPVGTVILPLALLLMSGGKFFFGYAKPVPFNPRNFVNERTGMLLTGIAGPATNITLAVVLGLVLRVMPPGGLAFELLAFFVLANLILAFFNLVPIPPLDGSRVLQWFLPDSMRDVYHSLERFGFLALIALMWVFPSVLDAYVSATVYPVFSSITGFK